MTMTEQNSDQKTGILFRIAGLFGAILTFLLPLKFGTFVSTPEMPLPYWTNPVLIVFGIWPCYVFCFLSAVFLVFASLARGREPIRNKTAFLWIGTGFLLPLLSSLGWIQASCRDYAMQMSAYSIGMYCYTAGIFLLLDKNPRIIPGLLTALVFGIGFSCYSGFDQYFIGYPHLKAVLNEQAQKGIPVDPRLMLNLEEGRLAGDFAVCNIYGAYLAMLLPLTGAALWLFGSTKVKPEKSSRWLLSVPAVVIILILIALTGSRGALLSLCTVPAVALLFFPVKKQYKIAFCGIFLLAAASFLYIVITGRGFKSMLFRFDYDWAAVRMMAYDPLTGTGWGDFFHDFQRLKLLINTETPHTPHNMPLLWGSQCGIFAFAAACFVLFYPLYVGIRSAWRKNAGGVLFFGLLCSVAAGVCSCLLEITYECPGFFGIYSVIALMLMYSVPYESAEKKSDVKWIMLALGLFSAVFFGFLIRNDMAYSDFMEKSGAGFSADTLDENVPPEKRQIPPDQLTKLLQKASDLNPLNPFIWYQASMYFLRRGELYFAGAFMEQAIKLSPENGSYYLLHAQIRYAASGTYDMDKIICNLNQVRFLMPNNPEYNKKTNIQLLTENNPALLYRKEQQEKEK